MSARRWSHVLGGCEAGVAAVMLLALASPAVGGECIGVVGPDDLAAAFFNPDLERNELPGDGARCMDREYTSAAKRALQGGVEPWARGLRERLRRIASRVGDTVEHRDLVDDARRRLRTIRSWGPAQLHDASLKAPRKQPLSPCVPARLLTLELIQAHLARNEPDELASLMWEGAFTSQALEMAARKPQTPWARQLKTAVMGRAEALCRERTWACGALVRALAFYGDGEAGDGEALNGLVTVLVKGAARVHEHGFTLSPELLGVLVERRSDALAQLALAQARAAAARVIDRSDRSKGALSACNGVIDTIYQADCGRLQGAGLRSRCRMELLTLARRLGQPSVSLGRAFQNCLTFHEVQDHLSESTRRLSARLDPDSEAKELQHERSSKRHQEAWFQRWLAEADAQNLLVDGPASLRRYPQGSCAELQSWVRDGARVAVEFFQGDWARAVVFEGERIARGWTSVRNLRTERGPAAIGTVAPELEPAPELPCEWRFPYGYRSISGGAERALALARFVWFEGASRPSFAHQPPAFVMPPASAVHARCVAPRVDGRLRSARDAAMCCRDRPAPPATAQVTLFFPVASRLRPGACGELVEYQRGVTALAGDGLATETLRLLLEGPTLHEDSAGSAFAITIDRDPRVTPLVDQLDGVTIAGKRATVLFKTKQALRYLDGSGCARQRVRAPIEQTLRVLLGVEVVSYRVAGELIDDADGR